MTTDSILYREIHSQPDVLAQLLNVEWANIEQIAATVRRADPKFIVIAARGASDNAAMYAKYLFASTNQLPVALATPSLYTLYRTPPRLTDALVIGISQSGESPDILAVVQEARRQKALTLALTNFEHSPLAEAASAVIRQHAGEERAIAATKTYTTQLLALAMLSVALAGDADRRAQLDAVPRAVARALEVDATARQVAQRWRETNTALVLGRGFNYGTAFEAALKLKELAYVSAEPFSSADFMHGPIAIIKDGFPVMLIAPRGVPQADLFAVGKQLEARGAHVLPITDGGDVPFGDGLILPEPLPEWLSPLTAVIPAQLVAFYLTAAKGYDPDHPRGLTKVTRTM
jgi:glucosamine--fructose-6-phosphate aminotransferase (isomerizing)